MASQISEQYKRDYTEPGLRKKLKEKIQKNSKGGETGEWSARKAQLLKKEYEEKGGEYKHPSKKTSSQKSLKNWESRQKDSKKTSKQNIKDRSTRKTTSISKSKMKKFYVPTLSIAKAASKGIELRQKFSKGGTRIGAIRATQLKNRSHLSLTTIKRMHSYFCRHEIDKQAKDFGTITNPSKGYIAWLLWGGNPGFTWVRKILASLK